MRHAAVGAWLVKEREGRSKVMSRSVVYIWLWVEVGMVEVHVNCLIKKSLFEVKVDFAGEMNHF